MNQATDLRSALKAIEEALGSAVEKYRLALGCCALCGDFFEVGDIAVAMFDYESRIQFEHETCPEQAEDYGTVYRNPQQLSDSDESTTLTESGINKLP